MGQQKSYQIRDYIKKVVKIRYRLVKYGTSHRGEIAMVKLKNFIDLYQYFDDTILGKWLANNYSLVAEVLPGKGSASHSALLDQLTNLIKNYEQNQGLLSRSDNRPA
jgi:hypothetical protein